jgi:hypothetical protein
MNVVGSFGLGDAVAARMTLGERGVSLRQACVSLCLRGRSLVPTRLTASSSRAQ